MEVEMCMDICSHNKQCLFEELYLWLLDINSYTVLKWALWHHNSLSTWYTHCSQNGHCDITI